MGLTEADAKALVNEGVLSADYDEHKEAIEFYDKALKIIETVSYTHLTLPTKRIV